MAGLTADRYVSGGATRADQDCDQDHREGHELGGNGLVGVGCRRPEGRLHRGDGVRHRRGGMLDGAGDTDRGAEPQAQHRKDESATTQPTRTGAERATSTAGVHATTVRVRLSDSNRCHPSSQSFTDRSCSHDGPLRAHRAGPGTSVRGVRVVRHLPTLLPILLVTLLVTLLLCLLATLACPVTVPVPARRPGP